MRPSVCSTQFKVNDSHLLACVILYQTNPSVFYSKPTAPKMSHLQVFAPYLTPL